jgi:hypothetical protein
LFFLRIFGAIFYPEIFRIKLKDVRRWSSSDLKPAASARRASMSAGVAPPFAGEDRVPANPRALSVCMDKLFDFVFTTSLPGMNERVKTPFRTPFQTLHYLQSLVSVVLGSETPACCPATEKFWEHLHRCAPAFPAPATAARARARVLALVPQQSPPHRGGFCRERGAAVQVHVPEATSHRQLWPLPRCAR